MCQRYAKPIQRIRSRRKRLAVFFKCRKKKEQQGGGGFGKQEEKSIWIFVSGARDPGTLIEKGKKSNNFRCGVIRVLLVRFLPPPPPPPTLRFDDFSNKLPTLLIIIDFSRTCCNCEKLRYHFLHDSFLIDRFINRHVYLEVCDYLKDSVRENDNWSF